MNVKNFYLLLCLLFFSCQTEKLDENLAQQRVENLLNDLKNNQFENIGIHFTDQFNRSEPVDQKIEKYKKLNSVLGRLNTMEVVQSESQANFGEEAKVVLQYRVKYNNATTIEDFVVVKDEGEYKIASHHIKNE